MDLTRRARYVDCLLEGYAPYQRKFGKGKGRILQDNWNYCIYRDDLVGTMITGLLLRVFRDSLKVTVFVHSQPVLNALMRILGDLLDRHSGLQRVWMRRGSFNHSIELWCHIDYLPTLLGTLFAECLV